MVDFYEYSTPELVRLLGNRFKEYRIRCNISLSTFIVLLKVVGQINTIDNLLPELPESPYLMRRDDKKVQRVRHSK